MFPIKFPGCPNTDPEAISSLPSFWIIQVKRLGPECANDVPVYVDFHFHDVDSLYLLMRLQILHLLLRIYFFS